MMLPGRSSSSSQSLLVSHFSLLEISLGSSLWFSQHAVMRHIKLLIPEPQQQDSPNSCRICFSPCFFALSVGMLMPFILSFVKTEIQLGSYKNHNFLRPFFFFLPNTQIIRKFSNSLKKSSSTLFGNFRGIQFCGAIFVAVAQLSSR